MGKQWKQWETLFSWAPKSLQMVSAAMKEKYACSLEEKLWQVWQHIKKQRQRDLVWQRLSSKSYGFPVVLYGCESWTIKPSTKELMLLNCGVGEDSWEYLGLQGDLTSQSWRKSVLNIHWKDWCWSWSVSTWPFDMNNWLIGKDSDAGKDWRQEEKRMTEDEMLGWHQQLDGLEFE